MACRIEELARGDTPKGAPRLFGDLNGNCTPTEFDHQKKIGSRKPIRFRERKTAERRRHITPK